MTSHSAHPSQDTIDTFIDAIWLEEGLSNNTLAAYRRDLTMYAQWLQAEQGRGIETTTEPDLQSYFAARIAQGAATAAQGAAASGKKDLGKATSSNRRLTVLKRYFRWALRERHITADPTLKLLAAKQALRVPKTMTESQVEALLDAPDTDTPLGLRDRTMLELMYASGLRVSELVTLKVFNLSMTEGVLRVIGKGNKERLVPFGEVARLWIERYLKASRPQILGLNKNQKQTPDLFVRSEERRVGKEC